MKTPKRHVELTTMLHDGLEMVWDNSQWNVSTQRWKRKNRSAQYKRTIAKLTFENNIFKQTFIQNRAFLKELMSLIYEPNRSITHRLADISAKIRFKLMSLKDYERKEQDS